MSATAATLAARGAQRPALSPDGATLYYASDRSGTMQLWSLPVAGGEPRPLTGEDRIGRYRLSPDGARIAYAADRGGNERWQLSVVPSGGGAPAAVTDAPDRMHHLVGWSPDARFLFALANRRDVRFFDLWSFALATGAAELRWRNDGTAAQAAILPDGRVVVRTDRERSDRNHLILVGADGTARRLTPEAPAALHGDPCPFDGALLALSDRGRDFVHVARIGLDGSYRTLVAPEREIDWLAASGECWAYAVNAEGWTELHVVERGTDRVVEGLPQGAIAIDGFG
ncbi:MAG: TolB family protein, partial [Candidatus Limnocylindria bacterium]